jgi:transcriptional regulator with XRE-family HTH domain
MTKRKIPPAPPPALSFDLRHRMARALEHSGVGISDIAARLGVSRSTISNWLHGRAEPRSVYLALWAEITQVDTDWLATGAERPALVDA